MRLLFAVCLVAASIAAPPPPARAQDVLDPDKIIADETEAIRLDPEDSEAYYNRGSAWYAKGEHLTRTSAVVPFGGRISIAGAGHGAAASGSTTRRQERLSHPGRLRPCVARWLPVASLAATSGRASVSSGPAGESVAMVPWT